MAVQAENFVSMSWKQFLKNKILANKNDMLKH